jgi:ABC-type multidrug transport system fused ATPase/permease subunit
VLIEDGRVAAEGTHAQLLATSSVYREVLAQAEAAEDARRVPDEAAAS